MLGLARPKLKDGQVAWDYAEADVARHFRLVLPEACSDPSVTYVVDDATKCASGARANIWWRVGCVVIIQIFHLVHTFQFR